VRGDLELHKAKNVLEEIWPDRVSAALAALPFCATHLFTDGTHQMQTGLLKQLGNASTTKLAGI